MMVTLSKARFKPRALEYLRRVELEGVELVITDRGRPVARVVPYHQSASELLADLRGSVLEFADPTEPVGLGDWEALDDPA